MSRSHGHNIINLCLYVMYAPRFRIAQNRHGHDSLVVFAGASAALKAGLSLVMEGERERDGGREGSGESSRERGR